MKHLFLTLALLALLSSPYAVHAETAEGSTEGDPIPEENTSEESSSVTIPNLDLNIPNLNVDLNLNEEASGESKTNIVMPDLQIDPDALQVEVNIPQVDNDRVAEAEENANAEEEATSGQSINDNSGALQVNVNGENAADEAVAEEAVQGQNEDETPTPEAISEGESTVSAEINLGDPEQTHPTPFSSLAYGLGAIAILLIIFLAFELGRRKKQ